MRPTRVEIDLGAVVHNLGLCAAVSAPAAVLAVVKADAYGHGAVPVARAIEASGQASALAVSLLEEGFELRHAGVRLPVIVLGSFYGDRHAEVVRHDLEAVVTNADDVTRLGAAARAAGRSVRVHLKVDTGMSRLGASDRELDAVLAALRAPEVELSGLCTHFACADAADPAVTLGQLARFAAVRARVAAAGLRPRLVHAANSAGAVRFAQARFDAVRPGIALYGIDPDARTAHLGGLRPAMRFASAVIAVRDVAAGELVSYDGLYRATRPSRIAVLPVGYADGYPRRLSGLGDVLIRGRRCRVAGTVCMDMTMVDVTDLAASAGCAVGDEAVLLGAQGADAISADELATRAGLSHYEIPCGISKRVPRVYLS